MELDGLGGGAEAAAQRLPPAAALTEDKLIELRKQALIVNELMRHFWALLPVNTEAKTKKFHRLQVGRAERVLQIGEQWVGLLEGA